MKYIKVTCHVRSEDADNVSDYFFTLGCLGIELVESDVKNTIQDDHFGEIYTLNQSDYPDVGILLIGYFDELIDENNLSHDIKSFFYEQQVELVNQLFKIEQMDEVDYTNSWKDYYSEIIINEKISIVPSWFDVKSDKINIKIEPGLGFGTGSHPTTYMCLNHLTQHIKVNDSVCDLGTGSGVIAILAKKLGAKEVYGIDLDLDALKNAKFNAGLNQIEDIKWTDQSLSLLDVKFDLIVANIVRDVIIELLPDIIKSLNKNGLLIISGITKSQKDDIIKRLVENGFQLIKSEEMKDFVSFVFRK